MHETPDSSIEGLVPTVPPAGQRARRIVLPRRAAAPLAVGTGVVVFILALELLKSGAGGVAAVLGQFSAHGFANVLGFGWLMAYLSLSGSPVAAASLTLLGGGALSPLETFAMINGSRFGASFIVLFTGFLYYLRGIRGRGLVSIGILAMATTATIYLPAMGLGALALRGGWLEGIRFGSPGGLASVIDVVYGPITSAARAGLPDLLTFILGFVTLLAAFRLFDLALPQVEPETLQSRWGRWLDRPLATFLLGVGVTALTLSVSVSLTILVPLASRGYIRRDQVIPYIMGANVSTFVDTLFASLLVGPQAFTIVLTIMAAVAAVSLLVLGFWYRSFEAALLQFNLFIAAERRRFYAFVGLLGLIPLALLAL